MDIEQITYETYDRVDRLDRDLRRHMKKEKTESGSGTTINTSEITSSIKGADDVNLSDVNTKIDGCGTTICGNIKGTDDVDLTLINEKLDKLTKYVDDNPTPIEFEEDPFKLDEEFTGYESGETFYNEDSIECNVEFKVSNPYHDIVNLGLYCEGETYSVRLDIDCETTKGSDNVLFVFPGSTMNTRTHPTASFNLANGRNVKTFQLDNINVNSEGNSVIVRIKGYEQTIHYFKVTVIGKNIKILNKPMKYKVFERFNTTLISKLENYKAYMLTLDTSKLNPVDLTKKYELIRENVKDYEQVISTYYDDINYKTRGFNVEAYLDLDGKFYYQVKDGKLKTTVSYTNECFSLIDSAGKYISGSYMTISRYGDEGRIIFYGNCYMGNYLFSTSYAEPRYILANARHIRRYNVLFHENYYPFIFTTNNGTNYLWFGLITSAVKVDIGKGYNINAYYDKNDENKIHVYMKLGKNMIKKTLQLSTISDEEGNSTQTCEIITQRIIGTYDYYWETTTNVYFVVKDEQLYMFKNQD